MLSAIKRAWNRMFSDRTGYLVSSLSENGNITLEVFPEQIWGKEYENVLIYAKQLLSDKIEIRSVSIYSTHDLRFLVRFIRTNKSSKADFITQHTDGITTTLVNLKPLPH